jgi:hypothetical protein
MEPKKAKRDDRDDRDGTETRREDMDSDTGKVKLGFTGTRCDVTKLPKCLATARSTGKPCQRPAEFNVQTGKLGRCYFHGSRCTGPRTVEGRARVAAAQLKHGKYSKATKEAKRAARERLASINSRERGPE